MKGLRLHVRWTAPEDAEPLRSFFESENQTPPPTLEGAVGKVLGEIVAHASLRKAAQLEILSIYVTARLRRKRVGRLLLSELARLAAEGNFTALSASNECPARSYLLREGFEERGAVLERIVKDPH